MTANAAEMAVLRACAAGPRYSKSFSAWPQLVRRMVERGLVERCAADGTVHRNMIRLTDAGRRALGGVAA